MPDETFAQAADRGKVRDVFGVEVRSTGSVPAMRTVVPVTRLTLDDLVEERRHAGITC